MNRAAVRRMRAGLVLATLTVAACSSGETPDVASDAAGSSQQSLAPEAPASSSAPTTAAATTVPPTTAPPTTAEPQPAYVTGASDFLFDQNALHTFELTLDPPKLAVLDEAPSKEEYVEGSLTFNGETISPIGVRYKGSIGAFASCTEGSGGGNPFDPSGKKACTKLSIKLKLNWSDSNDEFYGVRRVQLHSQNLDQTMMHERLGYWILREMGVPAPRSTHARVVVNGEFVGVFALTEQVDGRFTRANFEDGTGNLYQEVWPFDDTGAPQPEQVYLDHLETNEDENPSAELSMTFAAEMAAAKTPGDAVKVLDKWADVDTMLRTVVVDRAIQNDDGALHWYCFGGNRCSPHNFFWYEDPTEKTVHWIPWDLDNSMDDYSGGGVGFVTNIADPFGETRNDCKQFPFGGFNLPQRSAACDPLFAALATLEEDYERIRAELLAGPMSVESINEQLDTWVAQIESSVAEADALHDDALRVEDWKAAVERLRAGLIASRDTDGR